MVCKYKLKIILGLKLTQDNFKNFHIKKHEILTKIPDCECMKIKQIPFSKINYCPSCGTKLKDLESTPEISDLYYKAISEKCFHGYHIYENEKELYICLKTIDIFGSLFSVCENASSYASSSNINVEDVVEFRETMTSIRLYSMGDFGIHSIMT